MIRIGTSGYQCDHWKGLFYPADLRRGDWFRYNAGRFDTVEINNTCYNLPGPDAFDRWHEQAPPGFLFVLKFSRYGSHLKKLLDPEDSIARFLEQADRLRSLFGPILVQSPPGWRVNVDRLAQFLAAAPADHRWAVEFRDASWLCPEVYSVLRSHNAAICVHDLINNRPRPKTADWVYLRFHGDRHHAGNYTTRQLSEEASRIRSDLARGMDVFAYFNNDVHGHAVKNAATLRELVNHGRATPEYPA
jgi:uncharacterized protein YecE (DUF72 family)